MTAVNRIIIMLTCCAMLQGCVGAAVSATAASASVLAQQRRASEVVEDTTIYAKIKNQFLQKDVNILLSRVNVQVREGRVLLTGIVPERYNRIQAVEIAWQQQGVKEVINEIKVDQPTDNQLLKKFFRDNWIAAQLKTKMVITRGINPLNYSVDCVDQTVYLFGLAKSEEEKQKLIDVAANIKYVNSVVNYIRLADNGAFDFPEEQEPEEDTSFSSY